MLLLLWLEEKKTLNNRIDIYKRSSFCHTVKIIENLIELHLITGENMT